MYLKIAKKEKGMYLTIVEKYWDKNKKCSREKTAKIIGYLDSSSDNYNELVSSYKKEAAEMTKKNLDKLFLHSWNKMMKKVVDKRMTVWYY